MAKDKKYVYFFGEGKAEGTGKMKDILGGKGAGLAEMTNIGLPVPAGFTISAEVCDYYYKNDRKYPEGLVEEIEEHLKRLESVTGKKFGDTKNPLLVSVRSGAAVSMPGMMDTILNLGLNDESVVGLSELTKNPRFAYDAYRRFIQMFGDVVMGISKSEFEHVLENKKKQRGVNYDSELTADDLKEVVKEYKEIYKKHNLEFPQDPRKQLDMAIEAVFKSWMNERAIKYREINEIRGLLGTAVNVVEMVFGNMGEDSGTGVGFTRNPNNGDKEFYAEFLPNAQGEDVVAGIRTPMKIDELKRRLPEVYDQLLKVAELLEKHYKDVQDIEFTVERGKLYLLQTRSAKRTGLAAVRIAVDLVEEGIITEEEAISRVQPSHIDQLLHPMIDPSEKYSDKVIVKGLPASPGAATGQVVFFAKDAEKLGKEGKDVILLRPETSPEDVGGMHASKGILTARGGLTSHAAVVARGMGKPCIVGCEDLIVDEKQRVAKTKDGKYTIKEGDWITIDGKTGEVILGKLKLIKGEITGYFAKFMSWVDKHRKIKVRANAETPEDARKAREFGAEGIGLARTEHMFFGPEKERILYFRSMIISDTYEDRVKALEKLKEFQRRDFEELLEIMEGLPVTIRLLDPPLHEFLPHEEEQMKEVAKELGVSVEKIKTRYEQLKEFNPMLGFRGSRLAVVYPEIYEMQIRAIFEAASNLKKKGKNIILEIMLPIISEVKEFVWVKRRLEKVAKETMEKQGVNVEYTFGTMIEVPRAALTADEIAKEADFFSFGTNDLTQMTFAFSRDDVGKFIDAYKNTNILEDDPFKTLDVKGVGELIKIGIQKGRKVKPNLKVGICGEHGGDPRSIHFCYEVGMDYVSASPYRVPIARLAAAQASVADKKGLTAD
ncbi:MAG: pyruvate, phosphate dikinase [Spirochaetia bacterium]|nr:pyruvate, phosphate dikinase [Spirochaetota bacterium]MCX8096955.1 pyruvate, phosphate dikinase [Spirochaetota bacterium]MDW8112404.1 pyruvate, phosphate dikinase [Spirochaetia bacterium]